MGEGADEYAGETKQEKCMEEDEDTTYDTGESRFDFGEVQSALSLRGSFPAGNPSSSTLLISTEDTHYVYYSHMPALSHSTEMRRSGRRPAGSMPVVS